MQVEVTHRGGVRLKGVAQVITGGSSRRLLCVPSSASVCTMLSGIGSPSTCLHHCCSNFVPEAACPLHSRPVPDPALTCHGAAVMALTPLELAGRTFPDSLPSGKAKLVLPAQGTLFTVRLARDTADELPPTLSQDVGLGI